MRSIFESKFLPPINRSKYSNTRTNFHCHCLIFINIFLKINLNECKKKLSLRLIWKVFYYSKNSISSVLNYVSAPYVNLDTFERNLQFWFFFLEKNHYTQDQNSRHQSLILFYENPIFEILNSVLFQKTH